MTFTELRVGAFRALVDITLPLRPLNVVIGPNGVGKTTLLETFVFLQAINAKELNEVIHFFGGLESLIPLLPRLHRTIEIGITAYTNGQSEKPVHFSYDITLTDRGQIGTPFEKKIYFTDLTEATPKKIDLQAQQNERGSHGRLDLSGDYHPTQQEIMLGWLSHFVRGTKFFSAINTARNAVIRTPQTLIPTIDTGGNGETLFAALYNIRENYPDQFEYIKDILRTAFPGFQDLLLPVVGAGLVTLGWKQEELTRILYPNELSEGTLRFLWLTTLLLSPEPASLTLIDEPEVSLHPELLHLLAGLLQTAALRGQVMVATQSADLIRWLEPEDIVIADKEDGRVRLTRGNEIPVIDDWIQEYTLGDLWRMGVLGGRG
jgi:predicted ATPase